MNFTTIKLTVFGSALLLCTAPVTPGVFGQQPAQRLSQDALLATAREIMGAARYSALITIDSKGAHARTMDPFPPDENMLVWFGTNPNSRKVAEIRRDNRVTLYYFDRDGAAYVTISGIARLVNDPKEKAKRWKDEWKAFYPDRENGYLLIAVTPQVLEIVSEKKGIVGDAVRWTPPTIRFGSDRHASLRGTSRRR